MKKIILLIMFSVFDTVNAARVLHYCMNDNAATATVVDARGNYNGTYKDSNGEINTSSGSTTGKVNNCLDFDYASQEYIDIGDPLQSVWQNDFSISLWCKPDDGQPDHTGWLFGVSESNEDDVVWITIGNNGVLTFYYQSNNNNARIATSAAVFSDGAETWHHIVCVADESVSGVGGLQCYFDSSTITPHVLYDGDTSGVVFDDFTIAVNPYIGAEDLETVGAQNWYDGLIDDVRIYSEALTQTNVDYLYNGGSGLETDFEYYFLADAE